MILISQKKIVTSGTLLNMRRPKVARAGCCVTVVTAGHDDRRALQQPDPVWTQARRGGPVPRRPWHQPAQVGTGARRGRAQAGGGEGGGSRIRTCVGRANGFTARLL